MSADREHTRPVVVPLRPPVPYAEVLADDGGSVLAHALMVEQARAAWAGRTGTEEKP